MKKTILKTVSAMALSSVLITGGVYAVQSQEADGTVKPESSDIVAQEQAAEGKIEAGTENKTVQIPKVRVKAKTWDGEKIKELFLSSGQFEYRENDSNMFKDGKLYIYDGVKETGEEFWTVYETGRITAEYRNNTKGQLHLVSTLDLYDFGGCFGDKDLSLFTREDAENTVKPVLEKLGITNAGKPEIHAISAEEANEYLAHEGYGAKGQEEFAYPKWEKEDEVYVLEYPLMYENLPLSTECTSTAELGGQYAHYLGSYIKAVVSKDKILSLDGYNLLSPDNETAEGVPVNCDYESALKKGNEYFADWTDDFNRVGYMGTYDYRIENCQLVYVPGYDGRDYTEYFSNEDGSLYTENVEFTLIPLWRVDATIGHSEDSVEGRRTNRVVFIDPQTGNVM